MIDGIIKADGTSRLVRSVSDFKTRFPNYDAFAEALMAGTLPLDILFNAAGWSQLPDLLNKANLLKDDTAAKFGLGSEAVLDDAFAAAKSLIDAVNANAETKAKIVTGSYTGTGKYGSSNKNKLTFESAPKALFIQWRNSPTSDSSFVILSGTTMCANVGANGSMALCYLTFGANYVQWYNENTASAQANTSGAVYAYVAIL